MNVWQITANIADDRCVIHAYYVASRRNNADVQRTDSQIEDDEMLSQ